MTTHTPVAPQVELAQSELTEQVRPVAQRAQAALGPPQSTSVSVPLRRPSPQEMQRPPAPQVLLSQSAPTLHARPSAQRAQPVAAPPQSTSLSPGLSTPFSQGGSGWQVSSQRFVAHCASALQVAPTGHRPQAATLPQSMLGSWPF
jgi:hypothetical protein